MDAIPGPAAPAHRADVPLPPPQDGTAGPAGHPDTFHAPARPARTPRPPLARRLVPPLATLAAVAAAFGYVGTVDPNRPGHYPVCPLYGLTGLYCPACGGLRSAHAVAHGDVVTALGDNALAVVGYAVFAVLLVLWFVRVARGLPAAIVLRPVWWWALGGLVAVFAVLRNLPLGSSLAP